MNNDIFLTKAHRGVGSTLFTGRPEGKAVRKELKLNEKDKTSEIYTVYIPEGSIVAASCCSLFVASASSVR